MTPRIRSHIISVFAIVFATWAFAEAALGQKAAMVSTGQWTTRNQKPAVLAPVHEFVSSKQKSMITSGFPTWTSLTIAILNPGETSISESDIARRAIYEGNCAVTFDTWEERYEVDRLTGPATHLTVDSFEAYAAECLTGVIADAGNISKLEAGGLLVAALTVKQSSPEETAKIKEWLVKQQSGVMQGLFSHMLGDLSLQATAHVILRVPSAKTADGVRQDQSSTGGNRR